MKVIKTGRSQIGWSRKFECTGAGNHNGGCAAILLVSECDIYSTGGSYCGSIDAFHTFYTFCCCECGVETDIPEGKHPPNGAKGKRPTQRKRNALARKRERELKALRASTDK